jgi:peptidoglycan hydrolase-like protein with peptidoglycan-binding domain
MKGAIMKTNKQLLLGATLLAGTCFAVGPAWSQGDSRLRQGAPIGSPLNPGTADPAFVKKVQQALKDKGVYSGKIDGKMGPSTRDAIRAFQKANNLNVTADKALDDETIRALGVNQ